MLRHYDLGNMPPTYRGKGDLIFVDDASEGTYGRIEQRICRLSQSLNHACAFQLGYPADEYGMNGSNELGWWKLKDPIRASGDESILTQVKDANQELGFIWVTALGKKPIFSNGILRKEQSCPCRTSKFAVPTKVGIVSTTRCLSCLVAWMPL